jgi:hypothetical protein
MYLVSEHGQLSWIRWTSLVTRISQHCRHNVAHFLRHPISTPSSSEQDNPPHQEAADQVVDAVVIAILRTRIYPRAVRQSIHQPTAWQADTATGRHLLRQPQ